MHSDHPADGPDLDRGPRDQDGAARDAARAVSRLDPATNGRALRLFLALAFGLSWLVWLPLVLGGEGTGAVDGLDAPFVVFAVLGTFAGPFLAGLVVSARYRPVGLGAGGLLRAILRGRARWTVWATALLAPLAATTLAFVAVAVLSGAGLDGAAGIAGLAGLPVALVVGVIGGPLGEEPGWRGTALPLLQRRLGPVPAALVLGVVWAVWHLPLILFVPAFRGPFPAGTFLVLYVVTVTALSLLLSVTRNAAAGGGLLVAIAAHSAFNRADAIGSGLLPDQAEVRSGVQLSLLVALAAAYVLLAAAILLASRRRLGLPPAGSGGERH